MAPMGEVGKFRFQSIDEFLNRPPARWIVKGVLPEAGLGVVFGASGSGKTFWTFDLAASIARGVEWRGRKVKQGQVAYVVAEGEGGFRDRVDAYCREHAVDRGDFPLRVLPAAPNMMATAEVKELSRGLKALGPLSVIVMDTYARVMGDGNENEAQDANKVIRHCGLLHQLTGAIVLLVHHSGKDSGKGARGSSVLRAAADVEIEVVKVGGIRQAEVTKMKDGADGGKYAFKLAQVEIGRDEDGEPITSCVVNHQDAQLVAAASGKPLKPLQHLVLHVLATAAALDDGSVHLADLQRLAAEQAPRDPSKKTDNRRRDVERAIEGLIKEGVLEQDENGYVSEIARTNE